MPTQATPEGKARALANLRPIQKGEVLNPNGRRGKLSPLDAIRVALQEPYDIENPAGPNRMQVAAHKLVGVMLEGKDADKLAAWNILLKYFEGEPVKPLRAEIRALARKLAEETGDDPDALIEDAERYISAMYDNDDGGIIQGDEIP